MPPSRITWVLICAALASAATAVEVPAGDAAAPDGTPWPQFYELRFKKECKQFLSEKTLDRPVDCAELWADLAGVVQGKHPCDVSVDDWRLGLIDKWGWTGQLPADSAVFWDTLRMQTTVDEWVKLTGLQSMESTLLGTLLDPYYCGSNETESGWAPDSRCFDPACSGRGNGVAAMWMAASNAYAALATGTMYVVLDTEAGRPLYDDFFFRAAEVPSLTSNVTKVVVYPVVRASKPGEGCGVGSLAQLEADLQEQVPAALFECVENEPSLIRLLCDKDDRAFAPVTSYTDGNGMQWNNGTEFRKDGPACREVYAKLAAADGSGAPAPKPANPTSAASCAGHGAAALGLAALASLALL